jgi:hypothetical protein
VQIPRGDGSTIIRLRQGASISDFAEKIEVMSGFHVPPGNLVTVLFQLGEMATATESLMQRPSRSSERSLVTRSRLSRRKTRTRNFSRVLISILTRKRTRKTSSFARQW